MRMSEMTTSKGAFSMRASALSPLSANSIAHSRLSPRSIRWRPWRIKGSSSTKSTRLGSMDGQADDEGCAFADFGFVVDRSAVLVGDDGAGQGQSLAGAFAHCLGGEEGLEQMLPDRG